MASASSSSVQPRFQVFLSFRGEDTRQSFTSHLLEALKRRGISVFFDEEKLKNGEELTPALLQAIAASKISIIVLSKDYASSKSCLAELSKIMECKDSQAQIVLPIFHRVNPSRVRHPDKDESPFKESFRQHLINKPMEGRQWKAAFTQVGSLKGWHIHGCNFDRSETDYIKEIVGDVIEKLLGCKSTRVSNKDLVGIDDQMKKILLLIEKEYIRVIGIWGMGGIGKTTLAEAVYNEVVFGSNKFDAHCFLRHVGERSLVKYGHGMQSLEDELLSKLFKGDIHVKTCCIGNPLIQDRLRNVRLFVVFDDVSDLDQVERLGVELYGPGSKVIVTSRDRQLLMNIDVDELHKVETLDEDDSLKLFCKFAFKQESPVADFLDLSYEFLRYCGGNPLALKVLGATLYKKTRDEWRSALKKLEGYPEDKVFGVLKISLDGLGDLERNIFLDLACFMGLPEERDDNVDYRKLLEWLYDDDTEIGVSNLYDKCLLSYDDEYDLTMHDLLIEMGKDIVRKESNVPSKRSRLWIPQDVYQVLKHNKGTESIKLISLDMSEIEELRISPAIFEKMDNLVFVEFTTSWCHNKLLLASRELSYLPDGLRYFRWDECPLKSLPSNFDPRNLVVLKLWGSNIDQLWDGDQDPEFVNLKELDLSYSKNLRRIPKLSRATKLKTLECQGCESLTELPCMRHLISLEYLDLRYCPISKFPEIPNSLNLEALILSWTRIAVVPSFIGSLKKLCSFDMSGSEVQTIPSSILELNAPRLDFSCCPNLTELNLNIEEEVPSSIPRLRSRIELDVSGCKSLKSVLSGPILLKARNCTSLERVSFADIDASLLERVSYRAFDLRNCFNLNQEACDNVISAFLTFKVQSRARRWAQQLTKKNVYDAWFLLVVESVCYLPGSEISDKFEKQSRNSSITVKLEGSATSSRFLFLCFAPCVVFDTKESDREYSICCEYELRGRDGVYHCFKAQWNDYFDEWGSEGKYVFVLFREHMFHIDMNYTEASFHFKVTCDSPRYHKEEREVEKCGLHVFYVDAETFTVSDVGSSIDSVSDEDNGSQTPNNISPSSEENNRLCNPAFISPNSSISPNWLSLAPSMIEQDANVEPAATISRIDSKRSFCSDDYRDCNPTNISPNSLISPNWLSLDPSMIEEDANVDPAATIRRLIPKRSFCSDHEEDHEPNKKPKLFH